LLIFSDRFTVRYMRNIVFSGRVERGEGMATRLGCPTANIAIEHGLVIPGLGVYVGEAEVDGECHNALICINDGQTGCHLKMEVHLLNISKDLFGKYIKVDVFSKLRDLIPFPGEDKMSEMIQQDLIDANKWFQEHSAQH
jgi:riboflavin kinase / FMN adenylyltransferase